MNPNNSAFRFNRQCAYPTIIDKARTILRACPEEQRDRNAGTFALLLGLAFDLPSELVVHDLAKGLPKPEGETP